MDKPPSHLLWSILVTLFCCQPLGIVAIVFSAMSMSYASNDDMEAARNASDKARLICWIAFGIGFAAIAGYLIFVVGLGVLGSR